MLVVQDEQVVGLGEEPVLGLTLEVARRLHAAVVLALGSVELHAHPHALPEVCHADEAHGALVAVDRLHAGAFGEARLVRGSALRAAALRGGGIGSGATATLRRGGSIGPGDRCRWAGDDRGRLGDGSRGGSRGGSGSSGRREEARVRRRDGAGDGCGRRSRCRRRCGRNRGFKSSSGIGGGIAVGLGAGLGRHLVLRCRGGWLGAGRTQCLSTNPVLRRSGSWRRRGAPTRRARRARFGLRQLPRGCPRVRFSLGLRRALDVDTV